MNSNYHIPVMADECLTYLLTDKNGAYVDATFGGGGHSKLILSQLDDHGKLYAFDRDLDALMKAESISDQRFKIFQTNYRYIAKYLKAYKIPPVNGILADLGISSHQIDKPERGFSIRYNGPLDMRMEKRGGILAQEVVEKYSRDELQSVFSRYGEIKNAKTLADKIVQARSTKTINTTEALKEIAWSVAPKKQEYNYLAKLFQAIRIEVNDELGGLEEFLEALPDVVAPNGRIVIMTYHSLEDRLVKNFIKEGKLKGVAEKDLYGHSTIPFKAINRKPIVASESEIEQNPRARSAKLRVAERM